MATLFWVVAVFVLAVMIRLPNLYESFWVDELHTAWCIWGDLDQVASRAAAGNQTPLYFQMMWFWKALVGESELDLRMSSVLAVALASALLVVGVRQTTKSLAAGVLSGLILAIESSSIFFGTEFRPYAFVMLLSTIATWAAVNLLGQKSTVRPANLRLMFVVAVGVAALLHPTAIVTLGLLAIVVIAVSYMQAGLQFKLQISDLISLMVIAAVAFALFNSTLGASWEDRSRWAAFGKVTHWRQLWIIWPWLTLAIAPTFLWLVGRGSQTRSEIVCAHLPMFVALLATVVFFLASYFDWVPLWHRRYFIAVLPMMAWSAGACAMLVLPANPGKLARPMGWVIVVVLAGTLFWQQGAWKQFQVTQTWGQPRGEDWRGAVAWVNQHREADDRVCVDGDLIEDSSCSIDIIESEDGFELLQDPRRATGYFVFPVAGPYRLTNVQPFESPVPVPYNIREYWIVGRSNPARIRSEIDDDVVLQTKTFGRVSVMRIEHQRLPLILRDAINQRNVSK